MKRNKNNYRNFRILQMRKKSVNNSMQNKKPISKSGLNIKPIKSYLSRKIFGKAITKPKAYLINLTLILDFNSSTKT